MPTRGQTDRVELLEDLVFGHDDFIVSASGFVNQCGQKLGTRPAPKSKTLAQVGMMVMRAISG